MRFILILFSCAAFAQLPRFGAGPMTTDERIKVYEQWVAADPKSIANQTLLAASYIQKTRESSDYGYLDRASKIVDRILADKKDYEALRLRNLIELNRHNFSKVAENAREMARSAPLDPQNWGSLGDALMEMGQYEGALDAYKTMLSIRPNLFSYNRMANYRFITGDVEGAVAMMSDAVKAGARYPENMAWCLVELGNIYFKTGRRSEAEQAYTQAIQAFPTGHAAYAGLGSVKAAEANLAAAIEHYKHAQAIAPMPQYAAALRDLYEAAGNKAEAQGEIERIDAVARLEAASNQKANRTLALIYANQDRNLDRALELAQVDFQVRKDVYTYDALAWALYKNKRYEEALKCSQEARKMGTPEALFFYHAGMIARALGDEGAARRALEKALSLNDGFDIGQAKIARVALRWAGSAQ
jgi:tetratricopeptide (TPR) repeat protein